MPMLNEDDTVMLPALKWPANVKSIPRTRRVLTNRCLQSVVVMQSCWNNGIDLPVEAQDYRGAGKPLIWDDGLMPDEHADEASIGG